MIALVDYGFVRLQDLLPLHLPARAPLALFRAERRSCDQHRRRSSVSAHTMRASPAKRIRPHSASRPQRLFCTIDRDPQPLLGEDRYLARSRASHDQRASLQARRRYDCLELLYGYIGVTVHTAFAD